MTDHEHTCDPNNPDCAAYLYYEDPANRETKGRGQRRDDFNIELEDVKGKVVVFTTDVATQELFDKLEPISLRMREAGAATVVVLTDGMTMETLNDAELAEMGLQHIPET